MQYPISPEDAHSDLLKYRWDIHPPEVFVHVAEPAHDLFRHLRPDVMIILKRVCQ